MSEQNVSEKFTKIEKDLFDIYDMIKELTKQNKDLTAEYEELSSKFEKMTKQVEKESETTSNNISGLKDSVMNFINKSLAEIKEENKQNLSEVKNLIEQTNTELNNLKTYTESQNKELSLQKGQFNSFKEEQNNRNQEFNTFITEFKTNLESINSSLIEKIEKSTQKIEESLNETKNTIDSKIAQTENEIAETLNLVNENVKNQISEQRQSISNLESSTQGGFEKVFVVIDNHANALKSYGSIFNQLKSNIELSVEDLKKDQENLMSSIQKIIMGQIENIRNELLTFSKEIRTNLNKFESSQDTKFTTLHETKKLTEKVIQLEDQLRAKSEDMRKELSSYVEEAVKKFDSAIKQSISSVDEYRVDLERFKDDIESLIERKVNEKTEFSNELFNNLLTKSEQLTQLIRDSKIDKIPEIAIPIPEIKDSKTQGEKEK
jgi:chromosome segregation ATPase